MLRSIYSVQAECVGQSQSIKVRYAVAHTIEVVMGAEYPNPTTVSDSYRTPAFDDSTTSFHPYLLRTTPNKKVSNVLPPKKKREGKKKTANT